MKFLYTAAILTSMFTFSTIAAERKAIHEVDADAFTDDTQVSPKGTGDNHLAITWWIPNEFWESILSRDASTSEEDKKAMLDALSGVSLLAIVQADISNFGAFTFYTKETIRENIKITSSGSDGEKHSLSPLENIGPDLQVVLGVFKPILGSAMGNLGNNMHFYVLNDTMVDTPRLMDPYKKGNLAVQLTKKEGDLLSASIETPLNALFIPRKCPNGKDAHISWTHCPWTGKKLAE